jgi:hypothetical protein
VAVYFLLWGTNDSPVLNFFGRAKVVASQNRGNSTQHFNSDMLSESFQISERGIATWTAASDGRKEIPTASGATRQWRQAVASFNSRVRFASSFGISHPWTLEGQLDIEDPSRILDFFGARFGESLKHSRICLSYAGPVFLAINPWLFQDLDQMWPAKCSCVLVGKESPLANEIFQCCEHLAQGNLANLLRTSEEFFARFVVSSKHYPDLQAAHRHFSKRHS